MTNPLTPEKIGEIIGRVMRGYRPTDSLGSCLGCRKLCKSFQSMPYRGAPFFIQSIHDDEIGEIDRAMRDATGEGVDGQGIVSADDHRGIHYACGGPRPEIRIFMK